MLELNIHRISDLPFHNLILKSELLSYEYEPLLIHYVDKRGSDILSYWVDFDAEGSRWLMIKVTKGELYDYLTGNKSLKKIFQGLKSEIVYVVDYDLDKNIKVVNFNYIYELTDKYLPKDNSIYLFGLSEEYTKYLGANYYDYRLQEKAFKFRLESTTEIHQSFLGVKEIGWFLVNAVRTIEAYIEVTANLALRNAIGDIKKLSSKVNAFKNALSPVASGSAIGSFEIWFTIDTTAIIPDWIEESKWKSELLENFKRDVLDVDYYKKESADIIAKKFEDKIIRKKIYEPFIKILENEDFKLTVTNHKHSFKKDYSYTRVRKEFRDVIIPPKTLKELEEEKERHKILYKMVFELEDGLDIKNVKWRKIFQNNLFITEEEAETFYPIESPIQYGETIINFNEPIKCNLVIKSDNTYRLWNSFLGLNAEGKTFELVKTEIKKQVAELLLELQNNPGKVDTRFMALSKYIEPKQLF